MLKHIDEKGNIIDTKVISTGKSSIDGEVLRNLEEYVDSKVDELYSSNTAFSVATHFGGDWYDRPALNALWLQLQDESLCASVLGKLVYNRMVLRKDTWLCTKSDMLKRDFEVMFYWPINSKKEKKDV